MDAWTLVRLLHVLGLAFFVGGQLMLVATVVPALRGTEDRTLMRGLARRFGIGSGVALVVLIATGAALAEHRDRWDEGTLHVKLALLVAVAGLTALHVVRPASRAASAAILLGSLAIVWLGVELAHG